MTPIRHVRTMSVVVVALGLASCGGSSTAPKGPPAALTGLPRDITAVETSVRDAANAFSFALWRRVNQVQRDQNVFISPLSASFALGMTMNGAATHTWAEMRAALQFGAASQPEINAGYRSLIGLILSLDSGVRADIANSIWYRAGFPFRQTFFDTTRRYFDAEVRGLNFDDRPASLAAINGWVDEKTSHAIPRVLDDIDPSHVMFLINAIYFKGSWRTRFDQDETRAAPFHAAGGATQTAQLMHLLDSLDYSETPAYQAVDLPYGNTAFTMTVLLPREGTDVETLAASLTADGWPAVTAALRRAKVDLSLPRLRLTWERKLNDDLQALGMVEPFNRGGADFTGMAPPPTGFQLFIDFVKQNTFVDVNEEGTEAAAVTTVGIGVTSAPVIPVMRVDRPYLFVLRERFTGTLLFMGKVVRMP